MNEKLIQHHMEKLDISREEAIQLIADDKKIDQGEKLFELTPEQKKASKQARITTGKVEKKAPVKRERKADDDKAQLIGLLMGALNSVTTDFEVLNPEREFTFNFNNRKFKITLSAPRK